MVRASTLATSALLLLLCLSSSMRIAHANTPVYRVLGLGAAWRMAFEARDAEGGLDAGHLVLRIVAVESRRSGKLVRFRFEREDGRPFAPTTSIAAALPSALIVTSRGLRLDGSRAVLERRRSPVSAPHVTPRARVYVEVGADRVGCFAYSQPSSGSANAFQWRFCLDASGIPRSYEYVSAGGSVSITDPHDDPSSTRITEF